MYSVFVLQEMRVEYSIRHVINRREYLSYDIRRTIFVVLDTLIIAWVKEQESEAEGERKLLFINFIPRWERDEGSCSTELLRRKSRVSQIVRVSPFLWNKLTSN